MKGTNTQPPYLGPRLPRYPVVTQVVRVTSGPIGNNVYPCRVALAQDNLPRLRTRDAGYLWEPNGVALGLAYYKARLMGQYLGLPLYITGQACCITPPPPFVPLACCPDTCYSFTATGFDCPLNGTYQMTGTQACNWFGAISSSSSPSSSSSGAPTNINNVCCPPTLPAKLTATISASGGCVCLTGVTVSLNYNSGAVNWQGSTSGVCTGNTISLTLTCTGVNPGCLNFQLTGSCGGHALNGPVSPNVGCTCTPLSMTFATGLTGGTCCTGNFNIIVTD